MTEQISLTQEVLKEYLLYIPETGEFTWLKKPNRNIIVGSKAGGYDANGYLKIRLLREQYYAHRLAFLYMENYIPEEVDHIDLDKSNCAWVNLRPCTRSENAWNRVLLVTRNKSGVKGVRWCPKASKWKVTITANRSQKHLGYFSTLEQAKFVIEKARLQEHKEFAHNG